MDNVKRVTLCKSDSEWVQNVQVVQAPNSFLPRVAGEDEGEGWNDLNYLNGWNSNDRIATDSKGFETTEYERWSPCK